MKLILNISAFIALGILFSMPTHAQLLDAENSSFHKNNLVFDNEAIARHRIQEIKCEVFEKAPGKPMIFKGVTRTYTFNVNGDKLSKITTYMNRFQRIDTVTINYIYKNNQLVTEQTEIFNIKLIYNYKNDKNGNLIKRTYLKERPYNDPYSLATTKTEEISVSAYKFYYHDDNRIYKKEFINDVRRVYMTVFYIYNEQGNITREIKRRTIGGMVSSTKYKYNDQGLLVSKVVKLHKETKKLELKYDDNNNLSEEIYSDNDGEFQNFVFSENTHQLSSRVYKDDEKDIIYITRYEFKYHQNNLFFPFIEEEKPYDFSDTIATKIYR